MSETALMMKIWLPGESPWAEVLATNDDGSRVVRIDNKVAGDYTAVEFSEMLAAIFGDGAEPDPRDLRKHNHKLNDVITVKLNAEWGTWEPVPPPLTH